MAYFSKIVLIIIYSILDFRVYLSTYPIELGTICLASSILFSFKMNYFMNFSYL
jgi:hypothetical protein